ncbi:NUDIX domain-containing protein [Flexivirga oryzae]|uniref:8-oxo-dGTP pyrophosphatase MutT (NUDIX family) n=1 Tax=Flexivirga oryzae TaxID=1794944 RepID=A0A839N720_9MICO|nr:8-oxo-dGTP pyrophosphatase MutT (NUDIX family) [Flexivirga oryzae]
MTTTRDFEPPQQLRERAREWLSTPADERTAAPARLASTVLLLRESSGSTEVFMQRRVSSMKFAPSMWVFPGGGVDARDETSGVPWAGPAPREWARLMGVPEPIAQALVIAAVREVFEECGVLLAGPSADEVAPDVSGDDWQADRAALVDRSVAFAELLQRRGLLLRSDLLALQDHWITPELEPRRYDTWFFSALLPASQVADDRTSEAEEAVWRRPADALAEVRDGRTRMFPPTVVQLDRVAAWRDLTPVTASREGLAAVLPEPVDLGDRVVLRSHLND